MTEIVMIDKTEQTTMESLNLKAGDIFTNGFVLFMFVKVERKGRDSYDLIELGDGLGIPNNSLSITYTEAHELIEECELMSSSDNKNMWKHYITERVMKGELKKIEKVEIAYTEK